MSYTVLARRYRSGTFDEVIGQTHVAQTLKKAISSGRIAHAYLFCGTRGTGKTSTARILAKALNCEKYPEPTTEPCNECSSCKSIAKGDDIDVIEIDAASNTGVDNVRDIIENAQYRPSRSRFKVYIIDEVHMLSKSAFNALLKTLEEPPSHVKFILATTEPEKILPTILSRCQRYDFRSIPTREIAEHLKNICRQENIAADEDALLLVAKAGAGSMRDALSLLDRLLSIGEKQLTIDMIEQLLGLPKSQLIFDLAQSIGEGDVKTTLMRADSLISGGLSPEQLIASLTDHLRNLMILKTCGVEAGLVEIPGLPMEDLVRQANQFDLVAITQDIAILEELRRSVRQSNAGRALLDATLVRLALADQFSSVAELLTRVDGMPTAPAQKKKPDLIPPQAVVPATSSTGASGEGASSGSSALSPSPGSPGEGRGGGYSSSAQTSAAPQVVPTPDLLDDDDDLPAVGKVWEGPSLKDLAKELSNPIPRAPEPEPASNVEPVDPGDLKGVWRSLLGLVASHGPGLSALLAQGRYIGLEDGQAVIQYAKEHEGFINMLNRNGKRDLLAGAFSELFGKPTGIRFDVGGEAPAAPAVASPAANPQPARSFTPRAAPAKEPAPEPQPVGPAALPLTPELLDNLRANPLVKSVLETLGGTIVKVTEE